MKTKFGLLTAFWCILLDFAATDEWIHHTVLDGNGRYHLYWNPPKVKNGDSEIVFKAEVQTLGYVGFGLSPNGGMAGSDIVTGWVADSKVYFQDRHATEEGLPPVDKQQNWELLEGSENDTYTTLKFKRKLNTCDEEDMIIDDSTMRVIFAFSEFDPHGEDPIYHLTNRGTKSMMLLQSRVERNNILDDPSLLQWEIRSPNFTLPALKTMYWCKIYKTPQLEQKHHIVYVKPYIQEGHEEFLHHMLLYECVGAKPEEYDPYVDYGGHQCHHMNMPDVMKKCEGVSIAWAVGGEDVIFPEHVGLPLDPVPGKFFMLEIHYDNQGLKTGIIDESGLNIYYTPKLRQYDAGCLMLGSSISQRMFIPPHQEEYVIAGHSNPDCLAEEMSKDGIKVLGVLLHAHLIGRRIIARHFRKNKELPPLAVERNYDFNYQEYRYFSEEVDILLGDQVTVECTFNSSTRSETTFGGESTREEMCLAFILYYPRMERFASLSVPTMHNINKALATNMTLPHLRNGELYSKLQNYDWDKVNVQEVEKRMRYSDHNTHCYLGYGVKDSIKTLISYPEKLEEYIEKSSCHEDNRESNRNEASKSGSTSNWKCENTYMLLFVFFILFIHK